MRRKDSYLGHCLFRFMDVQMVWTWLVHKYKFVVKVQPKHKLYKRTQVHIFPTTLEPTKSNNKMSQRWRKERIFFESSSSVSLYYWQTKEALKEWIVGSQRIYFRSKNNHLRMLKVGLIYLYALKFSIFTWDVAHRK